jgi:hypothetical protein
MSNRDSDAWFALASFLASSARAGIEESVVVSSLRLVESLRRLIALAPGLKDDPFYADVGAWLERESTKAYFKSPDEFTAFLDDLLRRFAVEACVRKGLDRKESRPAPL